MNVRKKRIWIIEITIWLFIAAFCCFMAYSALDNHFSTQKVYQVVFKDVDSLSVGCPVRIMGIQVGYVTQIKPKMDQVFVNFVITNNKVDIPPGSVISIEFTGLAGSKSIEIKPPLIKSKSKDYQSLVISEPIRVNSLMELQTNISESIMDFSYNVLDTFGRGKLDLIKNNIKKSPDFVKNLNEKMLDYGSIIRLYRQKVLVGASDNATKGINNTTDLIFTINNTMETSFNKQKINNTIIFVGNNLDNLNKNFEYEYLNNLDKSIRSFKTSLNDMKTKSSINLNKLNTVNSFTNSMNKVTLIINKTLKNVSFQGLSNKTNNIKEQTYKLNKSL